MDYKLIIIIVLLLVAVVGYIRLYRHYGHTLEVLIKKACELPEGNDKRNLTAMICNHMKKDYMAWNKDTETLDQYLPWATKPQEKCKE